MINSPFSIFSLRTSHTGCSLTIIYAARPKLLLLRFFVQNSCCHLTVSVQFAVFFFSQNISCLTGMSPSPAGTSPPAHYTVPPFSIPPACHSRHTSADTEHIPGTPASQNRPPLSTFRSELPARTRKLHRGSARPKRTTIRDHSRALASESPQKVRKAETLVPGPDLRSGTYSTPHACRHPPGLPASHPAVPDIPKIRKRHPGIFCGNIIPFHNNTDPAEIISPSPGASAQISEDSCPDPLSPLSGARS